MLTLSPRLVFSSSINSLLGAAVITLSFNLQQLTHSWFFFFNCCCRRDRSSTLRPHHITKMKVLVRPFQGGSYLWTSILSSSSPAFFILFSFNLIFAGEGKKNMSKGSNFQDCYSIYAQVSLFFFIIFLFYYLGVLRWSNPGKGSGP